MKQKIQKWFRDILGITAILEQKELQYRADRGLDQMRVTEHASELANLKRTLAIGADITPSRHGESWAIVCVAGKTDFVKMYTFNESTGRDIRDFLRTFERNNVIMDMPHGMKKDFFRRY